MQLWGFLVCEGVRVFLCVLVLVWFGCVSSFVFALFAACVCFPFWVCSSVSVFVVFSCAVSCVLMDFRFVCEGVRVFVCLCLCVFFSLCVFLFALFVAWVVSSF